MGRALDAAGRAALRDSLMTCDACGHRWELQRAHIIRAEVMPEGTHELVECPRCGHVQRCFHPACEENGD